MVMAPPPPTVPVTKHDAASAHVVVLSVQQVFVRGSRTLPFWKETFIKPLLEVVLRRDWAVALLIPYIWDPSIQWVKEFT